MTTSILLAIVGNQVFPGLTGWWITYAVSMTTMRIISAMIDLIKALDK